MSCPASETRDLTRSLISTPCCRRMIWRESCDTRRECKDRLTGRCRDSWSPRKDEKPWNPLPTRRGLRLAKVKNEANKSYIINVSDDLHAKKDCTRMLVSHP